MLCKSQSSVPFVNPDFQTNKRNTIQILLQKRLWNSTFSQVSYFVSSASSPSFHDSFIRIVFHYLQTVRIKSASSKILFELVWKILKLKRRLTSQRNVEMARRMNERRTDDEFRLLDNRRRANFINSTTRKDNRRDK